MKVVIIDDEPWARSVIRTFGRWQEFNIDEIAEADDGESGLALIRRISPQIAIMDMRMPGMDGVELLHQLKEHHPEIKIIVISGHDDFEFMKTAILTKVNDYLLKPITERELNKALKTCIDEIERDFADKAAAWSGQDAVLDKDTLDRLKQFKKNIGIILNEFNMNSARNLLATVLAQAPDPLPLDVSARLQGASLNVLRDHAADHGVDLNDLQQANAFRIEPMDRKDRLQEKLEKVYAAYIDLLIKKKEQRSRFDFQEIKAFVDRNFDQDISLESIANRFYLSKGYLSKAFGQQFGTTLSNYITGLRMEKAMALLLEGHHQIKSVAELVGFRDIGYFYKTFKKYHHCSPGQIIDKHRPDKNNPMEDNDIVQ